MKKTILVTLMTMGIGASVAFSEEIKDPIRAGLSPMDNGLSYKAALGRSQPTPNYSEEIKDPIRAGLSPMDNGLSYEAALGRSQPTPNYSIDYSFSNVLGAAFRQSNIFVALRELLLK